MIEGWHLFLAVLGAMATVVGATWALRTKLSDIELAVKGHVSEDAVMHAGHEARIIKLEGRRKR